MWLLVKAVSYFSVLCGFSAKGGAVFSASLGQRPRTQSNQKTPALKARFTSGDSLIRPLACGALSALVYMRFQFLGRCHRL